MTFWLAFLGLNFLFFTIPYLLNFKNEPNPFTFLSGNFTVRKLIVFIIQKPTSDPWRVYFEYSLFILLCLFFSWKAPYLSYIGSLIASFGFVVIAYSGVMLYVFNNIPVIKSDIEFAKTGVSILYKKKYYLYAAIILFLLGILLFFHWTTGYLINHSSPPSKIAIVVSAIVIILLGTRNVFKYEYNRLHYRNVLFVGVYLWRNFKVSNSYNFLFDVDEAYFEKFNIYDKIKLKSAKPNIKIFSVESYGAIAHLNSGTANVIQKTLKEYAEVLEKKNYNLITGISLPPIFAGGSWLSYSSFLYGLKVDSKILHNLLYSKLKTFKKYNSLLHFFSGQGYTNYSLMPLEYHRDEIIDWSLIQQNLQYDIGIEWNSLEYVGQKCSYLLRTSPPDQYSLHKADDLISKNQNTPHSLFYSTLNSHTPFNTPIDIVPDWKSLNNTPFETVSKEKTQLDKYSLAINYQLKNIFNYIEKNEAQDTVYVLFGDHQPPGITKISMGSSTPVHIICKNKALTYPFLREGFNEGLIPENPAHTNIKHEGFFSLFMQGLNTAYGENSNLDLPYLPNGIQLLEDKT